MACRGGIGNAVNCLRLLFRRIPEGIVIDLKGHLVDVLTVGGIAAGVGIIAVNTEGTVTIIKLVGLYCDRTVGKFCVGGAVFSDIEKDNAVVITATQEIVAQIFYVCFGGRSDVFNNINGGNAVFKAVVLYRNYVVTG